MKKSLLIIIIMTSLFSNCSKKNNLINNDEIQSVSEINETYLDIQNYNNDILETGIITLKNPLEINVEVPKDNMNDMVRIINEENNRHLIITDNINILLDILFYDARVDSMLSIIDLEISGDITFTYYFDREYNILIGSSNYSRYVSSLSFIFSEGYLNVCNCNDIHNHDTQYYFTDTGDLVNPLIYSVYYENGLIDGLIKIELSNNNKILLKIELENELEIIRNFIRLINNSGGLM